MRNPRSRRNPARAAGEPRFSQATAITSLLFPMSSYIVAKAKAWARKEGFKASDLEPTGPSSKFHRLRQHPPTDFKKGSFRTIKLGDGVKAVISVPKRADVGKGQAFRGKHPVTVHRRGYTTKSGKRVKPATFTQIGGYGSKGPEKRARANPAGRELVEIRDRKSRYVDTVRARVTETGIASHNGPMAEIGGLWHPLYGAGNAAHRYVKVVAQRKGYAALTSDQKAMLRAWHSPRTDASTWEEVDARLRQDGIDPKRWKLAGRKLRRVLDKGGVLR